MLRAQNLRLGGTLDEHLMIQIMVLQMQERLALIKQPRAVALRVASEIAALERLEAVPWSDQVFAPMWSSTL
jgi:hypothetical protein